MRKKTLGKLLEGLWQGEPMPESVLCVFGKALKERNDLMHHFFREHARQKVGSAMEFPDYSAEMKDLKDIHLKIRLANVVLDHLDRRPNDIWPDPWGSPWPEAE